VNEHYKSEVVMIEEKAEQHSSLRELSQFNVNLEENEQKMTSAV
jgi:hypothetical protein